MKKSLQIVITALLLTGFSTQAWAQRNFYWVVGAGDWNIASNWRVGPATLPTNPYVNNATALGYSTTLTPPAATDNVYFSSALFTRFIRANNNNPGAPESRIVTIPGNVSVTNIDFSGAPNLPTFQIAGPFNVSGSATFGAGTTAAPVIVAASSTFSVGGSLIFGANAGNSSLTSGGLMTIGNALNVNSSASITANNGLSVTGPVTYGTNAGNSSLTVSGPATLSNGLTVNSSVAIVSNNALSVTGSVTYSATAGGSSLTSGGLVTISNALNVHSAVSIEPNGGLSVGGSVNITSTGASLALNGPTTIAGSFNLAAAGNITGTTGSLTFTSTSASTTIDAKGASIGVPVTFNGVGGRWTLLSNLTISNRATFVNGHVVALPAGSTGPNHPLPPFNAGQLATSTPRLIFTGTATAHGGSDASHVIGYVQKLGIPDGVVGGFRFIIGDGTYLRPLTSNEPTASILTARYLSVNPVSPTWSTPITYQAPLPTNGNGAVSQHEFWYYDAAGNSAPSITLDANHPNSAIAEYYRLDRMMGLTVASVSVSTSGNASWDSRGASVRFVDNPAPMRDSYNVASGGLSNSRVWITLGRIGNTSLPVHLVSFSAQQLDGQVQLKWQSSAEENTSHFEVEKSADGKNFTKVLTKKAQGNTTALTSYNAIDNSLYNGASYYRLKMVDLDETFEYSKIVAVSAESSVQVRAYPNPSKGNGVNIIANNGSKLVLKSVSDLFGKQVGYQAGNAAENIQISFPQPLPAGFYVATLAGSDNGQLIKVKFVVQ
jgi:hypothetical protein